MALAFSLVPCLPPPQAAWRPASFLIALPGGSPKVSCRVQALHGAFSFHRTDVPAGERPNCTPTNCRARAPAVRGSAVTSCFLSRGLRSQGHQVTTVTARGRAPSRCGTPTRRIPTPGDATGLPQGKHRSFLDKKPSGRVQLLLLSRPDFVGGSRTQTAVRKRGYAQIGFPHCV